jgi:hypothetical protein
LKAFFIKVFLGTGKRALVRLVVKKKSVAMALLIFFIQLYYLGVLELLIQLLVVMVIFGNAAAVHPHPEILLGRCLKARPSEPTRKKNK